MEKGEIDRIRKQLRANKDAAKVPSQVNTSKELARLSAGLSAFELPGVSAIQAIERAMKPIQLFDSMNAVRGMMALDVSRRSSLGVAFESMNVYTESARIADLSRALPNHYFDEFRRSVQAVSALGYTADYNRRLLESVVPDIGDRNSVLKNLSEQMKATNQISNLTENLLKTTAIGLDWSKISNPWLSSFSDTMKYLTQSAGLLTRIRELAFAGSFEFVTSYGWALPLSLPDRTALRLLELSGESRTTVRRAMIETFAPRTAAYVACKEALLESNSFDGRRRPIEQGLKAMRRGEHYSAVSTLLPLVEGALVETAFENATPPSKGAPAKAFQSVRTLPDETERELSERLIIRTVETLVFSATSGFALFDNFRWTDFDRTAHGRKLNRHAILHGAAKRYGTAENSMRLFLLLVALAEMLDGFDEARAEAALEATV